MFDYFKKHNPTIGEDAPKSSESPKRDKVFIAILIVFAVVLAVGFIAGVGNTVDDTEVENNFKFSLGVTDGVFFAVAIIGFAICQIKKRRK